MQFKPVLFRGQLTSWKLLAGFSLQLMDSQLGYMSSSSTQSLAQVTGMPLFVLDPQGFTPPAPQDWPEGR